MGHCGGVMVMFGVEVCFLFNVHGNWQDPKNRTMELGGMSLLKGN